jgi:phosphomannomutase
MQDSMQTLRSHPPVEICNIRVQAIEDYANLSRHDLLSGELQDIKLPQTNMFIFCLVDQTKVIVRPSGTEPKVKLYCGVRGPQSSQPEDIKTCDQKIENILSTMESILQG